MATDGSTTLASLIKSGLDPKFSQLQISPQEGEMVVRHAAHRFITDAILAVLTDRRFIYAMATLAGIEKSEAILLSDVQRARTTIRWRDGILGYWFLLIPIALPWALLTRRLVIDTEQRSHYLQIPDPAAWAEAIESARHP